METNKALTFSDGDFNTSVLESPTPVLVDFWAPWCGPCRVMAPTVDSLAQSYEGRVGVGKLNVDENPLPSFSRADMSQIGSEGQNGARDVSVAPPPCW